jgi:hypothetical protein
MHFCNYRHWHLPIFGASSACSYDEPEIRITQVLVTHFAGKIGDSA